MSQNTYAQYNRRQTPQGEAIPGRESDQVENAAGGFAFSIDQWKQLERFLILGTEGGTYYASERKLTRNNAQNVEACIASDGPRVVQVLREVSDSGRAPKNDPALFALALAASVGDDETRRCAFAALPYVARIPTHLFHFLTFVKGFRGTGGRGLRKALQRWYAAKTPANLEWAAIKYPSRDGWGNRDVLRLARPKPTNPEQDAVFGYIVNGITEATDLSQLPDKIVAAHRLRGLKGADAAELIVERGLPREVVPTELLDDPRVWEALLQSMPATAMIRNLGKMTSVGLLKPNSDAASTVAHRLGDIEWLRKSRIHPIQLLSALVVYNQGAGVRGSLTWTPAQRVVDALNDAFYASFGLVESTGEKHVVGIDVSGSMGYSWGGEVAIPGLTTAAAAACMAMVTVHAEPNSAVVGFDQRIHDVKISPRMRLDDVIRELGFRGGATDASLPFKWAAENRIDSDIFVLYTDNETWYGDQHPVQALERYRQQMGRPSKLAVVAMTATDYSVADQSDPRQMDFVGFDANAPRVLQMFAAED